MLDSFGDESPSSGAGAADTTRAKGRFCPEPPQSLAEAGLSEVMCEALVCKALLAAGTLTTRAAARATALPGKAVLNTLRSLKNRQFVFFKDSAAHGDFEYMLTDAGHARARHYVDECAYSGPAPVPLSQYIDSVGLQGITTVHPQRADLERAFADLLIADGMLARLGPAINSGRGLFLYGKPGNGKTSIAERITDCFGDSVWIPYAIVAAGEIITMYDPESHVVDDSFDPNAGGVDPRWVRIRRPTLVVGGELTMEALDLCHNHRTHVTEASLQLKSNTGTLLIDDFGRQRMSPVELLNRWIVPLERRHDYLTLSNGRKIKVPFDQLVIFSTNLEPETLVDDAFLRRIPYKIEVVDPTEAEFRQLIEMLAPRFGIELVPGAVDDLIERHYRSIGRPFRCCQPRDLLQQIRNRATYEGRPAVADPQAFDLACQNYFAML